MPAKPVDEEAFLSRWSRRKQAGPPEPVAGEVPAEPPVEEERTDEEWLADLDLPDPDTMRADDDFSAFMRARVPERLRRRALRTLWRSNPVLANLDELVDYGEDYTDAATVIENMQTVYEVGKGAAEKWKRHVAALAAAEEEAEEKAEEKEGKPAVAEVPKTAETMQEPEVALAPTPFETPAIAPAEPHARPVQVARTTTPPPRHMRFDFD